MKLTTVLGSVNNNPKYYLFIPKQIIFWKYFDIKFIAIFVGNKLPDVLIDYSENIILWDSNLDLHSAYCAQNIRMYYTALLNLPEDELVMITDMDMLPTNDFYYKNDLDKYNIKDFLYYRHISNDEIYMCYNAAHPSVWKEIFEINNRDDIAKKLNEFYLVSYNGTPGSSGWSIDQKIMYKKLINYKHLKVLNRPIKRLETWTYRSLFKNKFSIFDYDDVHFHRNYQNNEKFILDAQKQLCFLKTHKLDQTSHTNYLQKQFLDNIENHYDIEYVFEIGSRDCVDTIRLAKYFVNAIIYAFECDPKILKFCHDNDNLNKENIKNIKNINFFGFGMRNNTTSEKVYSYIGENNTNPDPNLSSFFEKINYNATQKQSDSGIKIDTIENFTMINCVPHIDILCMDVQGYELNILMGCNSFIKKIKYVIMKEPKPVINISYLPSDVHNKYIGAPTSQQIREFMIRNEFIEVARIQENMIGNIVLWKNAKVIY